MDDLKTVIELCIKAGWLPSEKVKEVRELIKQYCYNAKCGDYCTECELHIVHTILEANHE